MSEFMRHYSRSENDLLIEISVKPKQVGKSFLKTLTKAFSKKSENVDVLRIPLIDEVTRGAFNDLTTKLSNNMVSKKKKQDPYYVKNMYKGAITDPEELTQNYKNINSSTVFELNNGGKIYLISMEDDNGIDEFYIGGNEKVDPFFVDKYGKFFRLYLETKKIIRRTKSDRTKIGDDDIETAKKTDKAVYKGSEPSRRPTKFNKDLPTSPQKKQSYRKFGFVGLPMDVVGSMRDEWGNGSVGYGIFDNGYKGSNFYNNIKRSPYKSYLGKGYKYTLKDGSVVYLIKSKDNPSKGYIVFDGENSLKSSKAMDMIPWMEPGTKLVWKMQNAGSKQ